MLENSEANKKLFLGGTEAKSVIVTGHLLENSTHPEALNLLESTSSNFVELANVLEPVYYYSFGRIVLSKLNPETN